MRRSSGPSTTPSGPYTRHPTPDGQSPSAEARHTDQPATAAGAAPPGPTTQSTADKGGAMTADEIGITGVGAVIVTVADQARTGAPAA
jgi:hypothetical protein